MIPTDPNVWPFCEVVKDSFCVVIGNQDLGDVVPYEGDGEPYQILFEDNNGGDEVFINQRSLLRI